MLWNNFKWKSLAPPPHLCAKYLPLRFRFCSTRVPSAADMVILFRDTPYLSPIICDAMRIYGLYFVSQLINSPGRHVGCSCNSSPIIRDCDGLYRDNAHKSRSGF